MTLTVEDGTGLAAADSYVTFLEYETYADNRGWTLNDTQAADEMNLRRGFDAINRNWTYLGCALNDDQAGEFPREDGTVPTKVKHAQMEMAYLIKGGLDVFATISSDSGGSSKIKVGPIELESDGSDASVKTKPRVVAVETLLRPYLLSTRGQITMVRG